MWPRMRSLPADGPLLSVSRCEPVRLVPRSYYGVRVPIDPSPFLSTIVGTSATLVAIVGGLLVARFVGLDSDQRRIRKVLADARGRLGAAEDRSKAAARDVVEFDARAFFGDDDILGASTAARPQLKR